MLGLIMACIGLPRRCIQTAVLLMFGLPPVVLPVQHHACNITSLALIVKRFIQDAPTQFATPIAPAMAKQALSRLAGNARLASLNSKHSLMSCKPMT
jgi:hypothetical protein